MSLPAGTGVWVVNTVRSRAATSPTASSSPECSSCPASCTGASIGWPSLRWITPGSNPSAVSARTPPAPSSTYWARRMCSSDSYSRAVIQRSIAPFSGRSVSSRNSGIAADVDAPDLRGDLGVVDRDLDLQRGIAGAGHERGRQPLRIGVDPVLVLPSAGVDALAEVALAVHQADRDERDRAVRRLFQQVAGERAEAAGVDRQRDVQPVLGAQERHRPGGVDRGIRRAVQIGLDLGLDRGGPLDQLAIGGGAAQRAQRGLLEQPNRVLVRQREAVGVDRGEQLRSAGQPRPAVVVGEARQRREGIREPLGELLGGAAHVLAAVVHRHPAVAHGGGLSGNRYSRAS